MDEQTISRLEQLLEDNLELAEENNKMLLQIRSSQRWSFWGKLVLWILVLGLPVLFLGPILRSVLPAPYQDAQSKSVFGLPSAEQVKALLQAYQATTSGAGTEGGQ